MRKSVSLSVLPMSLPVRFMSMLILLPTERMTLLSLFKCWKGGLLQTPRLNSREGTNFGGPLTNRLPVIVQAAIYLEAWRSWYPGIINYTGLKEHFSNLISF